MAHKGYQPGQRVQLHRAVSKLGWGSRGQAWAWICAGEVCVDGRVVTDPLTWVDLDCQEVTRRGQAAPAPAPVVLALHKPRGIVTTRSDELGRRTVYDLLPAGLPWIFPAGRLDADSEGLLILTNDGTLSRRLTEPNHAVAKTYHVSLNKVISEDELQILRTGVDLPDGRTRPAQVQLLEQGDYTCVLEMVLHEGRNRQIRRMAVALGKRVRRLVRVAIGVYALGDLEAGAYRIIDEADRDRLLRNP
jgi:23S rRNA pseudouridine2605 synthase